MNSTQILAAIKILIVARDADGADVQPVIDELFAKWEDLNSESLSTPNPVHVAHANAVARMG